MKLKGIIGALVVLGMLAVVKYVIWPMVAVPAMQATVGWDAAGPELRSALVSGPVAALKNELEIPTNMEESLIKCMNDKTIAFLNTTECKYYYAEGSMTAAEHETAQEECLTKANFEAKQESIVIECTISVIPNDWKLAAAAIKRGAASEIPKGLDGNCVVDGMLKAFQGGGCTLFNPKATKLEELINSADKCMENPAIAAKEEESLKACQAPK